MTTIPNSTITAPDQARVERVKDGAVYVWEGVLLRTGSADEYPAVSEAPYIATRMHRLQEES